jgi:hypothetical protein
MAWINKAFIISANMIGYALYIKKINRRESSIRDMAGFCVFLNFIFITICIFMVSLDNSLIRVWGYKFGKKIILYCFNNPNSEALFLFLCLLSIWLFCKNKLFRIVIVVILACFSFKLTYGRTFFIAALGLIMIDILIKKNRVNFFSCMLILIPIIAFLISVCIGLVTRRYIINFHDNGLLGRFLVHGIFLKKMTFFNFVFGFTEEKINAPLDGSFFAIFVIMGFFMFMYLLVQYIKYIKNFDSHYSNYIPAMAGIVLTGITESTLAFFSINTVLLITLLVGSRRVSIGRHNGYCSSI